MKPFPAGDAPAAPTPVAGIAALSFAAFASAASLRVTDPALTTIAATYDVSLNVASYVITAFAFAYGMLQVVFGPAGDRFGKILVIACACAGSAATALLCAVAPTFATLLTARALSGVAAAAIIPLAMAWIGDTIPYERRQPVLARFLTGQILGLAGGATVGGIATDYFGWRWAFVFLAVWYAVAAIALVLVRRSLPPPVLVPHHPGQSVVAAMIGQMRQVVAQPWARTILLIVFLEGATLFGAFSFVATHVHQRFAISLTEAGSITLMFGFGGLVFAAGSRHFVRRLGEAGMAVTGSLFLGGSFLVVGLSPLLGAVLPAVFSAGLGFYLLHNTLQTQATQMAPTRRGAAVSLFAFCYFSGQSLGVAFAGSLLLWLPTGTMIALGGGSVMLVGLQFARLRRRHSVSAG